jgi:PAS domain-containing protein
VDNVHVQLAGAKKSLLLSGSLFRQENSAHLLILLSNLSGESSPLSDEKSNLLLIMEKIPDAFVVTDMDRRILTANLAFLDLIQAVTLDQVRGESFERWVGRAAARR